MKAAKRKLNPAALFIIKFLGLFAIFYGFYIIYLSLVSPGGLYSAFLNRNLNFVAWLRYVLIESSSGILQLLGYQTKTNTDQMLVVNHNIIHVGYDCLGFGVMSFFAAFVISYPARFKSKVYFLICGLAGIQAINIIRFVTLSLYWKHTNVYLTDHHTVFNIVVYILIAISVYFYTNHQDKATTHLNAAD
ncbi:exosortase Y [Mucilaginibacter litoreus]|uniref:Exosortase Y n=1 Tax=Mucilaginibacter litoreus TaxID=1048221 RepID=A0ABW3AW13_9SPHI